MMNIDEEHYGQLLQAIEAGALAIEPASVVRRPPNALTEDELVELMAATGTE